MKEFNRKASKAQYALKAGSEESLHRQFEELFLELDYLILESVSTKFCKTVTALMATALEMQAYMCTFKIDKVNTEQRAYIKEQDLKAQISKLQEENQRLTKELSTLTDSNTMYVDHDQWLETQRKLKKLFFIWNWL